MCEERIEARYLQEKTRDLFHLLQRIHGISPDSPLPVNEVADFTKQVGTIFAGVLVERRIFDCREDCYITLPPTGEGERELKK